MTTRVTPTRQRMACQLDGFGNVGDAGAGHQPVGRNARRQSPPQGSPCVRRPEKEFASPVVPSNATPSHPSSISQRQCAAKAGRLGVQIRMDRGGRGAVDAADLKGHDFAFGWAASFARIGQRMVQVDVVGDALARNVEGGAVIDRAAVDRQPDRNIHRGIEGHQLDRDVALIVILRDDQIEGRRYRRGDRPYRPGSARLR